MKVLVLITTHNRPAMLLQLLRQLEEQKGSQEITYLIVADGPQTGYEAVNDYLTGILQDHVMETEKHEGKAGYYKTINYLYRKAETLHAFEQFNYFIQIPDDIEPCLGFFEKSVSKFNAINNPDKACLNLLNDGRRQPGWTPEDNYPEKCGIEIVIRSGWVDMCFISDENFFRALKWHIDEVDARWRDDPERSSGVGMQISRRLYNLHKNMYMVTNSMVSHGTHDSQMHPDHRRVTPLVSFTPKEKVIAGMATMPGRETALAATIRSLINQVDELHIVLNGYQAKPKFLNHRKIFTTIDENNTYGDAAKFCILGKQGYLFFTDDDIIYPVDYVKRMITAIEEQQRRCIITSHGRRFVHFPVRSYYHDHSIKCRCLDNLEQDTWLHIPGSGVAAFHSETIKVTLADFKAKNMADIWLGIAAQREKVPVLAIKHRKGWITEAQGYDVSHSIHARLNGRDQYQTNVMNSIEWKLYTNNHE